MSKFSNEELKVISEVIDDLSDENNYWIQLFATALKVQKKVVELE